MTIRRMDNVLIVVDDLDAVMRAVQEQDSDAAEAGSRDRGSAAAEPNPSADEDESNEIAEHEEPAAIQETAANRA